MIALSCAPEEPTREQDRRTDGAPPHPAERPAAQRIVSLAPNLTEILFALDLGEQVVGVTDFCDHPEAAREKTRIGGFVNPNLEAILELEPDLALATPNIGNRDAVLRLEELGVEFLIVETPDLDGLYESIRTIAGRAGVPERGEKLVASLSRDVEAVRARVRGLPPATALMVFAHDPLVVAGEGTFFHDMLVVAGGRNVAVGSLGRFPQFSLEEVVRVAPQVIVETVMGPGGAPDVAFWERFGTIPAVRNDRICTPTPDLILRPGPRIPSGLVELADCLHPAGS